ncbi:MAG: Ppx/GppA phosphatase family protein [Gammaproteobacteria bacterium]|jgi:exopolyphosphatase/guanosine-5'-triphosphate,3'-diphosphate pyrophosphatase|nr:Ppx/GppA phosphatase family protein [Gammaproteobacteria bacterium]
MAAVDLGSNSFHMIIARLEGEEPQLIDRLRVQVRLAEGLNGTRTIGEHVQERALDCLRQFGQRLDGFLPENVRAVGTNALRSARNAGDFLERAEQALGHSIEIISGIEEARLIYNGAARAIAVDDDNRLVIDIGGGSTELIIGRGLEPLMMESLYAGCVTLSARCFPDGAITATTFEQALLEARLEFEPKIQPYRARGWRRAIGTSGTALVTARILAANGWSKDGVTVAGVKRLVAAMLEAGDVTRLRLDGLSADRAAILPGGIAILLAAMESLGIDHIETCDGALREGLLWDLVGRHRQTGDVRETSTRALARRYNVDEAQAERVRATTLRCFDMVADAWRLDEHQAQWLEWAARLHEIGLGIAHSNHQKHGAYVLANADLAGFSCREQKLLALLVLAHRRKFPLKALKEVRGQWGKTAERLALLLRIAVLLHHSRSDTPLPDDFSLGAGKKRLALHMPAGWLDEHPLTRADLEREAHYLAQIGIVLDCD